MRNTNVYGERRYYSAIQDRNVSRISMVNPHNHELFITIPDDGGSKYRELRGDALEVLETAVRQGEPPGPVKFERGVAA